MFKPVRYVLICLLMFAHAAAGAGERVFSYTVDRPLSAVYDSVYKSLEDARFYVVFEADIGANLAGFAKRWGEDYNRSKLDAIRSMVFCNGWYANQVSNRDPQMLAFCPLRMTLIEKGGSTTALFARPGVAAAGSPAKPVLKELEDEIIAAIIRGMQ